MQLLDIKPRDVYCLFEVLLSDLEKLKVALDHAEITLDLSDPEQKKVDDYIKKVFYPEICKTIKVTKDAGIARDPNI
jgi:hypothetical protein